MMDIKNCFFKVAYLNYKYRTHMIKWCWVWAESGLLVVYTIQSHLDKTSNFVSTVLHYILLSAET